MTEFLKSGIGEKAETADSWIPSVKLLRGTASIKESKGREREAKGHGPGGCSRP